MAGRRRLAAVVARRRADGAGALPEREAEIGDHSDIACLEIDDVDALHAEIAARGAIIRQAPVDRPYGMREMLIATPDGHRIMVGQPL
jgi:predicted enzyme related to lactoylglutathione lyase